MARQELESERFASFCSSVSRSIYEYKTSTLSAANSAFVVLKAAMTGSFVYLRVSFWS